jgi:hypothetical protein
VFRPVTTRGLAVGAAAALAGLIGAVEPADASTGLTTAPCPAYQLPGLPGGTGDGALIAITGGRYGGAAVDSTGRFVPTYWTHSGADWSVGWSVHPVPTTIDGFIYDITPSGLMVGNGFDAGSGTGKSFVFDSVSGRLTWLPSLGGGDDEARRMNASGVAAGFSVDSHGVGRAVTWSPPYTSVQLLPRVGGGQSLGAGADSSGFRLGNEAVGINDQGQTVGSTFIGSHVPDTGAWASSHQWRGALAPLLEPMTWAANGSPGKLPVGYAQGQAWAVNDTGLVVGSTDTSADLVARPAYWVGGGYHDMGAPTNTLFGNAYDVSPGDWAAGGIDLADTDGNYAFSRAFVWTGSGALQALAPSPGFENSWSHAADDSARQVGGDQWTDGGSDVPTVWQCPGGFTTR